MKWLYTFNLYFAGMLLLLAGCNDPTDYGALVPPTVDQDSNLPGMTIEVAGHERMIH